MRICYNVLYDQVEFYIQILKLYVYEKVVRVTYFLTEVRYFS